MSNTAQLANALILPCKEFADRHNGKETIIAMMTTTMQDVNGMVVIAVGMTSMSNTAQLVNVLTLPSKEENVEVHNGKETITAMMTTTMQDVNGMVVIVVAMMSKHNTAQLANVLTLQTNALVHAVVLNGKETIIAMMTTTIVDVTSMVVIAVAVM